MNTWIHWLLNPRWGVGRGGSKLFSTMIFFGMESAREADVPALRKALHSSPTKASLIERCPI